MQGWLKLFRKLADWEWYDDRNVKAVFIDLLIFANHQDNTWHGKTIKKGSLVTSLASIAQRNGLTIQEVRTALKKLEKTGEINKQTTNKNTLIIVLNYGRYQEFSDCDYENSNNQVTNGQQSSNNQITTNKNVKNDKNVKNISLSEDNDCQTETVQRVIRAWNTLSELGVKPVSKISSTSVRYKSLIARIKQNGIDDVLKAIENIRHSDFLTGKKTDFVITFDWFVKPNNFNKVFDGNYANVKKASKGYCEY